MLTYPTFLISYVYTVLYTIYCILPMTFCTITHSYIFMYIFVFIPLHLCVKGSCCEIVRLYYLLDITAWSELEAQAFRYSRINICRCVCDKYIWFCLSPPILGDKVSWQIHLCIKSGPIFIAHNDLIKFVTKKIVGWVCCLFWLCFRLFCA